MLAAGRSPRRRAQPLRHAAAGLAALATALGALVAAPAAVADDDLPTVVVAPVDASIGPDAGLAVNVEVSNPTDATMPATTTDILLSRRPIATRFALTRWFDETTNPVQQSTIATAEVPAIAAGASASVRVDIPADQLPLRAGATWGAYGLSATVVGVEDAARSVVTWHEDASITPTRLALAAPLTAPETESGLLTAEQLATSTATSGMLQQQLGAVQGHTITVGVDPMVAASVAALGASAPETASAWVDAVAQLPSTTDQPYAASDVIDQVRAGVEPVAPLGIPASDGSMLPPETGELGSASPSVIDATSTRLTPDLVTALARHGTVVLSTDSLDETIDTTTPGAHVDLGGTHALAADAELQRILNRAASASTEVASGDVAARALGLLAIITREAPNAQRTLAAVLPAATDASNGALLDAIDDAGFVQATPLDTALATESRTASLRSVDAPQSEAPSTGRVHELLDLDARAQAFATIVADPISITAPRRLALLAALGTRTEGAADAARAAFRSSTSALLSAVSIAQGSTIQIVGSSSSLPVTVQNSLAEPVTVTINVRPSNATLRFEAPSSTVTIPPHSVQRVLLPVEAVGAGTVQVAASLAGPAGAPIGSPTSLDVSTQPTIEAILLWVMAAGVVLLLGFGVWRSIRKRRAGKAHGDLDAVLDERRTERDGNDNYDVAEASAAAPPHKEHG